MLYLVRKIGESIIINGNIEVKLIEVKGKSAKLGFEFPPSAQVLRKEIHDRIVAENIAASLSSANGSEDFAEALSDIGEENKNSSPSNKSSHKDENSDRTS